MMAILRDHGDAPHWSPANTERRTLCMHAAEGARRSQSVASMVTELREGQIVHWVTGTSAPCTSLFKPVVLELGLPAQGPAPTDRFDARTLWWRHERLHRRMLRDFGPALAAVEAERDALETGFRAAIDRALIEGGLDVAIARCWAEAEAAEARWLAGLPAPRPTSAAETSHRRSWTRLNHVAGVPPG
jgi:hypothetical protein